MLKIKLNELHIENFKGFDQFTFETNGADAVEIYGNNATGKTTLVDAWTWLLFGKDSSDKTDFDIKPLNRYGETTPGLVTTVQAVIAIDEQPDGECRHMELKKTYAEKWTRKKGSTATEFTGHEIKYFIDDVPLGEGVYKTKIAELIQENVFKLLCNPLHFNIGLKWKERRDLLLTVCGSVSVDEVLASNPLLSVLAPELKHNTFDEVKAKYQAARTKLNKQLDEIPIRIDEAAKSIPENMADSDINDIAQLDAEIEALTAENNAIFIRKNNVGSDEATSQKKARIAEIEAEMASMRMAALGEATKAYDALRTSLYTKRDEAAKLKEKIAVKTRLVTELEKSMADELARADKRRTEYAECAANVFVPPHIDDICPTCGQLYPTEKADAILETAKAAFNTKKAADLENIRKYGIAAKQGAQEAKDSADKIKAELVELLDKQDVALKEVEALERQTATTPVYQPDAAFNALLHAKEELESSLSGTSEAVEIERAAYDRQMADIVAQRAELSTTKMNMQKAIDAGKRIEELREELTEVSRLMDATTAKLDVIDLYTKTMVEKMESNVAGKFTVARFKLFEKNINGGIADCCDTVLDGVPFKSINNAGRIQVGLDIIRTLSNHYGVSAPIWIDNNESVTSLPETDAQTIGLYVSKPDQILRIMQL